MRRHDRIVKGALALCAIYLVVAGISWVVRDRSEVIPFFAWDLFAKVPDPVTTNYGIRLVSVNGTQLAHPLYFEDAGRYLRSSESIEAVVLTQHLGQAIEHHSDSAARLRRQFQNTYLSDLTDVDFQVVKRTFDQRDRFTCHCYIKQKVLANYQATFS